MCVFCWLNLYFLSQKWTKVRGQIVFLFTNLPDPSTNVGRKIAFGDKTKQFISEIYPGAFGTAVKYKLIKPISRANRTELTVSQFKRCKKSQKNENFWKTFVRLFVVNCVDHKNKHPKNIKTKFLMRNFLKFTKSQWVLKITNLQSSIFFMTNQKSLFINVYARRIAVLF